MRKLLAACSLVLVLVFLSVCTPANSNSPATASPDSNAVAQRDKGNPSVKVWVNTASGVYHCPGTRWYGATKAGQYMTQKEALDKGNRPAYGKYCQ